MWSGRKKSNRGQRAFRVKHVVKYIVKSRSESRRSALDCSAALTGGKSLSPRVMIGNRGAPKERAGLLEKNQIATQNVVQHEYIMKYSMKSR